MEAVVAILLRENHVILQSKVCNAEVSYKFVESQSLTNGGSIWFAESTNYFATVHEIEFLFDERLYFRSCHVVYISYY